MLGEASGEMGVSSNSVVGVSGFQPGVGLSRKSVRACGGCSGFSGKLDRLLDLLWEDA